MIGFGNLSKRKRKAETTEGQAETIAEWRMVETDIKTLSDARLVKINPQEDGFYDAVLNFKSTNTDINAFIEAISEVKDAKLGTFYRPIYDPSIDGDKIVYEKGKIPAVYPYNAWEQLPSLMPTVEGKHWHLATEFQYYAFLVWLVNQLVKDGKSVEIALNMVVIHSEELGHHSDLLSRGKNPELEPTGSRCVCGVYDLANVFKLLACSYEQTGGIWICGCGQIGEPLACLTHFSFAFCDLFRFTGLLVLN